jgi:hypothetical protein
VRTKIDASKRRAETEKLFAVETIVPADRAWIGYVDFGAISDEAMRREAEEELLTILGEPLGPLGKTKTYADVEPVAERGPLPAERPAGHWAITLQSAAILADPEELRRNHDLGAEYGRVFRQISGGALELVNFFSGESFAGGYYLHRRFQFHKREYMPYLLTDSGSVFLLHPATEAASGIVGEWLRYGLPLPQWARERYARPGESDWQWCPYLPENGYGEIAVNLSRPGISVLAEEAAHANR